jgi:UDP-apiose/xylose synthase
MKPTDVISPTKSICVLGCGGFIGSHLVERLLREPDYTIVGLDIASDKLAHIQASSRFMFVNANIYEADVVRSYIEQCDTVISLVALCNPALYNTIPLDVIDANFIRPLEVVKLCSVLNKRLIQFSTSEVYGKTLLGLVQGDAAQSSDHLLSEDSSQLILGPVHAQRWSYACAKQLLERTIYAYGFERDLDYTIIRPFNFIGPRMDYLPGIDGSGTPRVLACFMAALLQGRPLQLVDGGRNRRCFTYIADAVDAVAAIVCNPETCHKQIFNIGSPFNETSIAALAELMIDLYTTLKPDADRCAMRTERIAAGDFYGEGYEDSDRRVPDISKIMQCTGWIPTTNLCEALQSTIAYYISRYAHCATMASVF